MKDPQSIAVSSIDDLQTATVQHYTYEYLDVVSNQIANLLLGKGIQLEDIVVICMEKSVMSYASMLGVLKAGGAYCCVDIKLPSSRKEFIIQDSDCKFVLTSNGEVQSLQSIVSLPVNQNIEVLNLDTVLYEELSSVYPNRNIQGHNLAYVIYTSGTTGQPKGVLVEHANVQHAMDGFSQMIPLTNTDHFLQFASLSFDVSVFEIFYTFMKGASLVTADQEVLLSDIVKCINILQVTHMDLTPTVASLITSREQVPTVRVLVSGGEGMTQQIVNTWAKDGEGLYNAYGPTEATIGCTMYCNVLADVRPSQIGKAFPSCSLYVISLGGELLPKGCIGELCVGGPQVTRGYLNRDEVTSKSFVTGYAGIPERMYRTGDMCRMLDDGSIEFCGRKDNQVKLNGRRIELESVTSVLQVRHPDIKYVTCLLRNPSSGKLQLITFLCSTLDLTTSIDNSDILDVVEESFNYAWDNLPSYMVPNMMIPIASEPFITTNGKLDLVSLQRMYENLLQMVGKELLVKLSGNFSAETPALKLEEELLIIVGKLLKLEPSSIDVNLHLNSYGLDSLSSVSLSHELKNVGYSVKSSDILKYGSVRRISLLMRAAKLYSKKSIDSLGNLASRKLHEILGVQYSMETLEKEMADIVPDQIEAILPCSPGQNFCLDSWVQSKGQDYFATFCLQSNVAVDKEKLIGCWNIIVQQNAVLRTGFICTGNSQLPWIQYVLKSHNGAVSHWNIPQPYSNNYIKHYIAKKKEQLDIIAKPPVEMELLSFSDKDIICINILHAMYDGWSFDIIMNQLQNLYHSVSPPLLSNSNNSTILGIGQLIADIQLKSNECTEYWNQQFKSCWNQQSVLQKQFQPSLFFKQLSTICNTCIANPNPSDYNSRNGNYLVNGKVEWTGSNKEILNSTILASYSKVLAKKLRQSHIVFGLYHMGRLGAGGEIESMSWPSMNIAPMMVDSTIDDSIEKLANQIRDRLKKDSDYQQINLSDIHKLNNSKKPLFNTFVNILKSSDSIELKKQGDKFSLLDVTNSNSKLANQHLFEIKVNPKPPSTWMAQQKTFYAKQSKISQTYLAEDFYVQFFISDRDIQIAIDCKKSICSHIDLKNFLRDLELELDGVLNPIIHDDKWRRHEDKK
ncbi:hypothetical protein HDV02_004276 [Globomyces sp. JEL0801]|nr:hypothetical protein HDV02_004276 [Globomyces sp. JEL0801]